MTEWEARYSLVQGLSIQCRALFSHSCTFTDRVIVVAEGETLGECANLFLVPLDGSPATVRLIAEMGVGM